MFRKMRSSLQAIDNFRSRTTPICNDDNTLNVLKSSDDIWRAMRTVQKDIICLEGPNWEQVNPIHTRGIFTGVTL